MQLTSASNPLLKNIRHAANAGRPTEEGLIVAEGPHLLEEALDSDWTVERILATPEARSRHAELLRRADREIVEVSPRAFASAAATQTPQEILTLLRPRAWSWADLAAELPLLVVLDGIQDPGNAGTIVRSAEAFGATGVIFLRGCARVANGKLLRAAAGSMFRVPFLESIGADEAISYLLAGGLKLYALASRASGNLSEANFRSGCALVVGNEGSGVSAELLGHAEAVSVQTRRVESLNASIACSIALFAAGQQRSRREPV